MAAVLPHSPDGVAFASDVEAWAICAATFARAQGAAAAVVLLTALEEQTIVRQLGEETTWSTCAQLHMGSREAVAGILKDGGNAKQAREVLAHDGQGVVVVIGRAWFEPIVATVFPTEIPPPADA